jgi:beta-lactamase regulating signal transducer with metallopeptidase domain
MISFASMIPEEITRAFAWTLIHSVWQGGLLALVASGVIMILRRHRPVIRYTLLCILLAMVPILFTGTFTYYYNRGKADIQETTFTGTASVVEKQVNSKDFPGIPEKNNYSLILFPSKLIDNQANLLVLIWFTGFLFFLFRFTGSLLFVYRMKNTRIFPVERSHELNLQRLAERIGLKKQVRLIESALAKVPLTIGYLKPVILLPLGTLSGVPPQQIDAILLHELAHIQRKDYLINILQSIVEILFFYHPAAWWLSGLIRQEREHICDDIAVSINQDHLNYIKALTTMEEFNAKSPLLVNAVTGSKKKLLSRVKRLVSPAKLRKSVGEGIIVFLVIIGLVSALSLNALTVIPDSFDLTGRESGEKVYNLFPYKPNPNKSSGSSQAETSIPDSIVSTSKSGKVIVKVYTDTIDSHDEENVQVFVETLEDKMNDTDDVKKDYRKEIIIKKKGSSVDMGGTGKVIIIKSGDSLTVFNNDTVLVLPEGYDTLFTANGGIGFYEFETPEIPEFPDFIYGPEIQYYIFDEDQKAAQEEFERALRDQEFDMKEFEKQHRELEKEMSRNMIIVENPEDMPHEWKWTQIQPEPEAVIRQSERIIRQELRDDGLTERGKKYVIELDSKAMYINGEKQAKEVYKKYRKLVESMEQMSLEGEETFKLIF